MTANKVATSGSIKNTILILSLPFNTREPGDIVVIRLRIIYSDSLNNNPFENFLRPGGNFQTFILAITITITTTKVDSRGVFQTRF